MSDTATTQRTPIVPLSEETRKATLSAQWLLERKDDAAIAPPFYANNLEVHICGENAFRRIAGDLRKAIKSIDIICWGFDPAMELVRTGSVWPRGDTWGGLLREAAKRRVEVRLLVWHDSVGSLLAHNVPGYGRDAPFELKAATSGGFASALESGDTQRPPAEPTEPRDRREVFNARWYRDAVAGQIEGLALRMRAGVHADVLASLQAEATRAGQGLGLGRTEHWGLEYMATHHQKTILIDYEGEKPCGYVMGLNSVTDYWDTQDHHFQDTQRGEDWEGLYTKDGPGLRPYQDYACRIEGEALVAVSRNFTDAWNKAATTTRGAGTDLKRTHDLRKPPANLIRHLAHPRQTVQIVRTLPAADGSDKTIARLYNQAASFARHYIYVENQYFQHADWVAELKRQRQAYLDGCTKAGLAADDIPKLHVMVVIPTPERAQMVPRTHEALTELGHGESVPRQDQALREEIKQHEAVQAAHLRDPLVVRAPRPLSEPAQAYQAASRGRDDEAIRQQLEGELGMRTLVASLWSCDDGWSARKHPVLVQEEAEQARYRAAVIAFEKARAAGQAAHSSPPVRPTWRKAEIAKAHASRYREIYIHSKLMVIDDSMFTLGSANLNLRSFAVDSELNMACDDPDKAKDLRQRVWAQHTGGGFSGSIRGAEATDQTVMFETFSKWKAEASDNLKKKSNGDPISCFLVKFLDERTSSLRLG